MIYYKVFIILEKNALKLVTKQKFKSTSVMPSLRTRTLDRDYSFDKKNEMHSFHSNITVLLINLL